jgi:hypothetical protein
VITEGFLFSHQHVHLSLFQCWGCNLPCAGAMLSDSNYISVRGIAEFELIAIVLRYFSTKCFQITSVAL